jgi:hypothetical protein
MASMALPASTTHSKAFPRKTREKTKKKSPEEGDEPPIQNPPATSEVTPTHNTTRFTPPTSPPPQTRLPHGPSHRCLEEGFRIEIGDITFSSPAHTSWHLGTFSPTSNLEM